MLKNYHREELMVSVKQECLSFDFDALSLLHSNGDSTAQNPLLNHVSLASLGLHWNTSPTNSHMLESTN